MEELLKSTEIDSETCAIFLEMPPSRIVVLQGIFESYEGLGTVRTLDTRNSVVCVVTTSSLESRCLEMLESVKELVEWRPSACPPGVPVEVFVDNQHSLNVSKNTEQSKC